MTLIDMLRAEARLAPVSGIEAVMNYGRGRPGLIPLWAGEGDLPTPDFINAAAMRGLADGETFYTWQGGIPELREALARYHQRHFGCDFSPDEFLVTIGGMQAITLALQATAGAGDEAIYLTPAWPNFAGGRGRRRQRTPVPVAARAWRQWLVSATWPAIEAAVTPRTKAIFVNTPANPTGWTADMRDAAGASSTWRAGTGSGSSPTRSTRCSTIGGRRAPSFMDIMEPEDRILFVNTFSKNWAMTGWRIGWLRAHPSLGRMFENLIQYSTLGRGAVPAARRDRRARRGRRLPGGAGRAGRRLRATLSAGSSARRAACASACRRARSTCSSRSTG